MRFQLLPVLRIGICERLGKWFGERIRERFGIRCPLGLGYCFCNR
jgi:hypothetical protein